MNKKSIISELIGVAVEPTYFDLEHSEIHPSEIVRIIKSIHANGIRLGMFSHQGHTYYPSKIAPQAPFLNSRNLLAEFEDACRNEAIHLVVYLNSKWVTTLYHEHPEWAVKLDGKTMMHSAEASLIIYPMCPNSPFLDYFIKIVREVVSISHPDAIYIDNFAIQPFCECQACRKKYGKDIPDKKNQWQSHETQHYLRWMTNASRKIAKRIVAVARSHNPEMPVIFNRGQFWSVMDVFSPEDNRFYAHQIADGVHTESAVRLYGGAFEHINEQCAFGRSIDLPVWTWVEYPMLPFSYVPASPAEAKIKAAKVLANGGRPMVWSMPCAPLISQKGMQGLREVFSLVSDHKDLFNNVSFDPFGGILFSSCSLQLACCGDREKLNAYNRSFTGAYLLMIRNHLPYDFILDDEMTYENLCRYQVVLLPNVLCLNRKQADALRHYVRQGGAVFATFETSLYSAHGERQQNFDLCDLFGAEYQGQLGEMLEGYSAGYARFHTGHPVNDKGLKEELFPIGGKYLAVSSKDALANLLMRCRYYCDHPQEETTHPAIIARREGKGKVVYIPGEYFRLYYEKGLLEYRQFFMQTMEWFTDGQLPLMTNLPDSVEVTVTQNEQRQKIIHLVNCSFDKTRPVEEIHPIRGKELSIRSQTQSPCVFEVKTGKPLSVSRKGDYLYIKLPPLTGYNVICLKGVE